VVKLARRSLINIASLLTRIASWHAREATLGPISLHDHVRKHVFTQPRSSSPVGTGRQGMAGSGLPGSRPKPDIRMVGLASP
jgi:hypothetical protein